MGGQEKDSADYRRDSQERQKGIFDGVEEVSDLFHDETSV